MRDIGDAQGQFATRDTATAGDTETLVFLRGAGVENDQLVAAGDAGLQVGGLDPGYVWTTSIFSPQSLLGTFVPHAVG